VVTSAPPATLTVIDPPVITSQPASSTNNAGTTATFTVVATGTAPLSYQWFKNASPLTDGGNISGSTNATLTVGDVSDSDMASYTVVVSNVLSSATSLPATLTVIDPPIITSEPASRTNNAGTTATFTVVASGTAPSYQWMKNSIKINNATNATLTLSNVQDGDAASYTVYVSNAAGNQTSTPATLTVIDPPVITSEPASRTNNAGTTATFTVVASGTAPNYQWMKNNININNATNATLTLNNVQDGDAASYTVYVSNAAGNQTSTPATLTVIDPPVITSQPESVTNIATTTATFTVIATGTVPAYQWFNGTNQLADGGKISGATSNVLTISNVLGADQGSYSVVVSNAAGVVTSSNALLVVIDPAILDQPVGVTNIEGSTVAFSVTAVGTQPLGYQWQQDGDEVEGATNATLTISNIADSDSGTYTVIITNSVGSITSAPAILVTVPPLIVSQPASLAVLVGQPASFTVGVNGALPFSYQWLKNGPNISGSTDPDYTISQVALTDAGSYQVVVTNPDGSQTSEIATLTVYATAAPTLTIISYADFSATLHLTGIPGFNYAIQGSTNFVNWIPLITNPAPYTFIDTNATTSDRFYRGVYLP
jgi:hypothetical protein